MFKRRSGASSSLHAPRGMRIHELDKNPRMKRKLSWCNPKVRNAASEGVLTHKPVILKEGFLYKPGFFKLSGRKRRWCVLRTYSQTEASIDIYTDETKSRFKGTISLDKDLCPMLLVKNYDGKKKRNPKSVSLVLKIGKRTYQFMADSFREMKEWSSLMRQAIDNGFLFSGKIIEPLTIEDGMVNLKFNSNCIAVICPIKENAIKTWRLNHITSFGQCGGILTFECCSTCSDPGTSRCSINVVQEKPSTILNLMEKAIRSNPNTSEIHYERSILGDIYHCDHDCGQPQRLLPAFSDPNLFRSASASPQKDVLVPIDIHEFEIPFSTLSSGKSNDSGLPGTPPLQQDMLSLNGSSIPSPSELSNKSSAHTDHLGRGSTRSSISMTPIHGRSLSETAPVPDDYQARRIRSETDPQASNWFTKKPNYSDVQANSSPRRSRIEDSVQYTSIQLGSNVLDSPSRDKRLSQQKLQPVDENDGIYDIPNCEPPYWEVTDNGVFSPLGNGNVDPVSSLAALRKSMAQSTSSIYTPGSDLKERDEDFEELPPTPSRFCRGKMARSPIKEPVQLNGGYNGLQSKGRSRLHSTGDVLDCTPLFRGPNSKTRGSVDNLAHAGRRDISDPHGSHDLLTKLHEQDEILSRVLARSRNERNEELGSMGEVFGRPYKFPSQEDYDQELELENHLYASPTNSTYIRSGRSSSSSDRGIERVLTKVASDTARGYAYKIQIPLSNSEYDVPRRAAPAPNLTNLRSDAPPKPLRYITSADP